MLRYALPARKEARFILLGALCSALGRGLTLPFLLVYLNEVRRIDAGTVGLLVGWSGLVALVLGPVGGTLMDRFGIRRVLLAGYAISAAGSGALTVVDAISEALVALTVVAVGNATVFPGHLTVLASLVAAEERQRTFGLSFTLHNLGIGIGGLAAGTFVDTSRPGTFQVLYVADALTFLVPLAILAAMPAVGRRVTVDRREGHGGARGYRSVLADRPFRAFLVFGIVLTMSGYAQVEVGFTAFASTVAEVPARVIAWAFAANTLIIVTTQLLVLRWLEGRSRTRALAAVGVIFAVSWMVLGAAGVASANAMPVVAAAGVIGCLAVFAVGEMLLSPVMPAITNALATDELRGRYNALGSAVFGLSAVAGPVVAGPLIGAGRAATWVMLVVGGCLTASVLALSLGRKLTPAQDGRAPTQVVAASEPGQQADATMQARSR